MKMTIYGIAATLLILLSGCQSDYLPPQHTDVLLDIRDNTKPMKTTGTIEVLLPGGPAHMTVNSSQTNGRNGKKAVKSITVTKRAFVSFEAFEATEKAEAKGTFTFSIMQNSILERAIEVNVMDVFIDPIEMNAWILGVVLSDTKPCGEPREHGDGCSGDHPEGTSCGGTEDGGHDEACLGEDHGGNPSGGGVNPTGKNCRIGQFLAINIHDGGTPAVKGDGIAWKWFSGLDTNLPDINSVDTWPHLCVKEIIAGNLDIHVK